MAEQKPKIIAIVGPTAGGKTSLSIEVARKFGGEIISADSRQVYRHLNIGTGKVTKKEMGNIPHHLLDVREPTEVYTVAEFKCEATQAIQEIKSRGRLPIIVGGTFFYLDSLRNRAFFAPVKPDLTFRKSLGKFTDEELFAKLKKADPKRATNIDKNNRRRLERALEVVRELGVVPDLKATESPYDWLIIGLSVPKEELRENFKNRLIDWLDLGFEEEVGELIERGVSESRFAEFGFEYTLMLTFINKEITKEELIEKFVQKNWQYAKRQMTWLKRDGEINWFAPENREAIFRRVDDFLNNKS
ncbi:tRNA (adenosine(37)-N6)-dimethylallyltransferase MiaA [Candidatus Kaiserbacteria bacterium]|nr:tRNA (adenosine(37)-N6)-dimethylallyltransferase MiaA [Candidatus Kaiserbacteria bacterium]USN92222.1 MAG: tRNA (adenosine(37)-N6)-dimethylallyltransferase MiaA [Candidatus Nomurabacteria bacterium]